MPKIICKVCNGTKDANYDLPSDEYVHYPCTACKEGIENYCKACDGQGKYWITGGFGDNAHLHYCENCNSEGFTPDFVEIEEDCECVKPREKTELEIEFGEIFGNMDDPYEKCFWCKGTKKAVRTHLEWTKEYKKAKGIK